MEQSNLRNRSILIIVVTVLLVWAIFHNDLKLGQDLKGGTTLRFVLDIDGAKKSGRIDGDEDPSEVVARTLTVIRDRIDKYGLAEISLTQYGENKFLISLPADSAGQAEGIIDVVAQLGDLKFRIEVRPDDEYGTDPKPARTGVWPGTKEAFDSFKEAEMAIWQKARDVGEKYVPSDKRYSLVKAQGTDGTEKWHFHVMEETNFPSNVQFDGGILENPVVGQGKLGEPVVLYDVRNEFQNVFGKWTGDNIGLPMAIILNDEYKTAPVIQDQLTRSVQITLGRGNRQDLEKEAKALATVLQTGSLKIRPALEAHTVMGASLAGESRERGVQAVIAAFLLVLVFMVLYYRSSGMIANLALLLNVVMLIGFLAFFQAVLTLPGIAGIVLTVGMAVDANILINERIREERRGGRTLRRAVAEGYARALSAIIDANVTSIITAVFLYNFGSGPVRGFAVTLAIGLMVSMFTAIFVTRTIFDGLIKRGWIQEVTAWGSGEPPRIRWLAMRRIFAPLSVIGVVVGLLIFYATDRYTLYDIDFTGGYKVQAAFHQPTSADHVRNLLAREKRQVDVVVRGFDPETKLPTEHTVKVDVGPYPGSRVLTAGDGLEIDVQQVFADAKYGEEAQAAAFDTYLRQVLEDRLLPDWDVQEPRAFEFVAPEGSADTADPLEELGGGTVMRIALQDPDGVLTPELLRAALAEAYPYWVTEDGRGVPYRPSEKSLERKVVVRPVETAYGAVRVFDVWMKATTSGGKVVEKDLKQLHQRLGEFLGGAAFRDHVAASLDTARAPSAQSLAPSKSFPSQDHIGSTVAQRLKNDALLALVLSLIGIIIYIAIRFKSRTMGFAAVLCLFHDVAITMGVVAVANTLGIVDAKINLSLVAAFLTLVGFSVNDTVVIFDRIRENRGKRPTLPPDLIDLAINQTLARTIRTTATFLLVCVALFVFNFGQRNVLEGFSFLLIVGSFVGTYSTIAISTPLLLYLPWLWERARAHAPRNALVSRCLTSPALLALTPLAAVAWLLWAAAFGLGLFAVGLAWFAPWAMSAKAEGAGSDPYARKVEARA